MMKRRQFLSTSGAALAAGSFSSAKVAAETGKRPNLLIIHCDELNFRTLGCYRETLSPEQALMWGPQAVCDTPHIDALAGEGTLCTKFYAATPVCSPSRSSFMTGHYPQNTPVTNNNVPMADEVVTFAHAFAKAGYATGYSGKWHLDGDGKPEWEPQRRFGFDDNRFMFNRGHWKQFEITDDGPRVKARDAKDHPTYSVEGADETSFATDWLVDRTIEFIDDHKAEPFCYMVAIPDPHGPDTVRAPYDTLYDDSVVKKPRTYGKDAASAPSWAKPQAKCPWKMASYHGMIKCIDDNVGRLVAALKERDLFENTIVVFTADHGDMRGEHHRQNKGIPLEASAKVPFVIRGPGAIEKGGRIDAAMNTTDFLPTILSLAGVSHESEVAGRNLAPWFRAEKQAGEDEDLTFFRGTSAPGSKTGWFGAVTSRHKLILSNQDDPWLLDLEADPDELINHLDHPDQSDTVKRLAKALLNYATIQGDPCLENPVTGETLRKLAGAA
ncbi:MAG: sulfatase [Verrucomicrobiae bacterium]|nr:sulfatase [Verrucomicrobiae bacterium]